MVLLYLVEAVRSWEKDSKYKPQFISIENKNDSIKLLNIFHEKYLILIRADLYLEPFYTNISKSVNVALRNFLNIL